MDQTRKLIDAGITDPKEIEEFLGHVNFYRVPNRLLYEDYERICTESSYFVLELDRQDGYNNQIIPTPVWRRRSSNPDINNMMTAGLGFILKNYRIRINSYCMSITQPERNSWFEYQENDK